MHKWCGDSPAMIKKHAVFLVQIKKLDAMDMFHVNSVDAWKTDNVARHGRLTTC
jgi:hypothetical protein